MFANPGSTQMRQSISRRDAAVFTAGGAVTLMLIPAISAIREREWQDVDDCNLSVAIADPGYTLESFVRVNREINQETLIEYFLTRHPQLKHKGLTCYIVPRGDHSYSTVIFLREIGAKVPNALREDVAAWTRDALLKYSLHGSESTFCEPLDPSNPRHGSVR